MYVLYSIGKVTVVECMAITIFVPVLMPIQILPRYKLPRYELPRYELPKYESRGLGAQPPTSSSGVLEAGSRTK